MALANFDYQNINLKYSTTNSIRNLDYVVISKKNIACLAELIFALISVAEGKTHNEALRAVDQSAAEIIADALAPISMTDQNIISF